MKAVILCGGFGSRLGVLTKNCPKPLLKIKNKSLLEWQILLLKKYGVNEIYINLHYLSENIISYIGNGSKFGIKIYYKYQDYLNGTAGAVKIFENELIGHAPFFVLYGDILFSDDLDRIIRHYKKTNSLCTIYMHKRKVSNSIVLCTNKERRITNFFERPTEIKKNKILKNLDLKNVWTNSSIYLMCPTILRGLCSDKHLDFPVDVFPHIIKQKKLFGIPIIGQRFAIDTPEKYNLAKESFISL